jgi:hypothetical protein
MKPAKRKAKAGRARRADQLTQNVARAAEYRKPEKRSGLEILLLASIVLIMLVVIAFTPYMVKTDLDVSILNQSSTCYSGEEPGSTAVRSEDGVIMETTFQIPDPCYRIESIKAMLQGNRIEVAIKTASGGICIQCFGFRKAQYEIILPEMNRDADIYVDVDGAREYVWLPVSAT